MSERARRSLLAAALVVLAGVALARIAATWPVYTPTFDEPAHLAAGMEWLDRGEYRYEPMHPPLARVAIALAPYLGGYRAEGRPGMWQEGNAILRQRGEPRRALQLARAGVLPFLLLATGVVFWWARALAGDAVALMAVLAFLALPPVLAHAGLATTDAAAMATMAAAIFALVRWLEQPSPGRTLWLGLAAGLALLAKMSALVFLPAAAAVVLLVWWSAGSSMRQYAGPGMAALVVAFFSLWAGYRFSVGPLREGPAAVAAGRAAPPAGRLLRLPVYPAPDYYHGLKDLKREHGVGRRNVLLGETIQGGRWYFFPVALAVKTPLPFLLLSVFGAAILVGVARVRRRALVPVLAAAAILGTAMAANVNIGVRHVLPVYPLLAVCAGVGAVSLWHWRRWRLAGPAASAVLVLWLVAESVRAHPDYLPYFNQLAGDAPERVLVDSDLDWGQDLGRLADTLRARAVPHVSLAYHGKADLGTVGLPPYTELDGGAPVTGWVAASVYRVQIGWMGGTDDPFGWLRAHAPVARVGKSILLYHIPPR